MNLAALWTYERARVGAQHEDPHGHNGHGNNSNTHHTEDRRVSLKRQSSNPTLGGHHGSASPTAAGSPVATGGSVKKKPSISAMHREVIYRKLMEESALPPVEVPAAAPRAYDCNEFAMEYADRAPKRFLQQQLPASAADDGGDHGAGDSHGAGHGASNKTQPQSTKRRTSHGLAPVSSRATGTTVASGANGTAVATTTQPPRRNPRKRGGGANGAGLELAAQAFRPYVGDMFSTRGDYVDGMLYMSRMKRSHQLTFGHDGGILSSGDFGRGALKDTVADALSAAVAAAAAGSLNLNATDGLINPKTGSGLAATASSLAASATNASASLLSEISPEEILQLKQRQRCSLTLSNWSSNPENARLMVQENVVEALILLCKASENDRVTKLNCVTTLMNLSHVDELRSEIVQQGAVKALVDIANEAEDDKTLRTASAVTLCNLCCCLEGEEEILVEDGAVSALSLLINEHPKTSRICLGALFNLTCVKEPYHKIESVLKVFLTLASSSTPSSSDVERDEIIAKAICNLSNFKRVRLRLMEEGIVSAISNLIHPHHPEIQQLLAYVLLNLSAMRACRSELVSKGCLGALVALTGATSQHDSETKCVIGLALWNLSKEAGNRLRMVFEGLLLLVNELCRGVHASPSAEAVRSVCARTIYNVSCSEDTRHKLVERDAVSILSSLSQRCSGDDGKKMCTLALCNLLSVQQAAADIVTAGAITSLIDLSMVTTPPQTLETKQLFSKALSGLCEMPSTRIAVVQANIIPAIIHLSSTTASPSTNAAIGARQAGLLSEIRARCTAALACLAADESIASQVCTPDVVRCVSQILVQERFNIVIERFCCACLSLLCRDEQCSLIVAQEGALQAVLSTCLESQDLDTKASCCHVLASMSCHPSCCMALVKTGVLSVLTTLSKIGNGKGSSGAVAQRCCAITLANLSADADIRSVLVTSRIVPLLALLSNSYSEDSQRDCARVLCNLSSVRGHELTLVREGALAVLMMISMVRALQPATKETCLRAFANLLTHETLHAMVTEGIIKVLPAFAGLGASSGTPSEQAFSSGVIQVVSILYGKLLSQSGGRHALCLERAALRALVSLTPADKTHEEDESLYETLLCELVRDDELRERSVDAGIVEALEHVATIYESSASSATRVALMLFTLAKHEATRHAAASSGSLATLVGFLSSGSLARQDCVLFSVSTLCHLAWHDVTRAKLDPRAVTVALSRLLRQETPVPGSKLSLEAMHKCLLTLCCLSHSDDHLGVMLQQDVLTHLCNIVEKWEGTEVKALLALVCILVRQLSHAPMFAAYLSKAASHAYVVIRLFCLLTKATIDEGDRCAALDCADSLCSITFISPASHNSSSSQPNARPSPFIRRQSQPQHAIRGAVAVGSSVPPSALVSAEVLDAVRMLLNSESQQYTETRWRCTAALFALSCISDYRHTLVRLGCTRLLVCEASAPEQTNSGIDLSVLRCCAGTLCNLTIVSGVNSDINAQKMVQEDAVPALIQLAKKENEEIREYCTLALSNLSTQSPKVECGAVSALLNLSLHSSHVESGAANSQVGVMRPPAVSNERYRKISSLPDHLMEPKSLDDVVAKKYEAAQGHASKPPPPHVPTMSADMAMIGGGDGSHAGPTATDSASMSRGEEVVPRQRKESSVGNFAGISPISTPISGSGSSRGAGSEGELRGWSTMSFPKIDPVESRAMSMDMDDDVDPADADDRPTTPSASDAVASSSEDMTASNPADDRSESEDVVSPGSSALSKLKGKVAANGLSPLARVVIRKTQTAHAINKLKDVRASNTLRGGLSSSSSSLALATVQEAQENSGPAPTLSGTRRQPSINKSFPLQKLGSLKTVTVVENSSLGELHPKNGASRAVQPTVEAGSLDNATENSLAAAAAAAMLYSTGPPAQSPVRETSRMQDTVKPKRKPKAVVKKKAQDTALRAEPPRQAPIVTTIEEVQTQAKLLGLWS